jgi:hypothetical protein
MKRIFIISLLVLAFVTPALGSQVGEIWNQSYSHTGTNPTYGSAVWNGTGAFNYLIHGGGLGAAYYNYTVRTDDRGYSETVLNATSGWTARGWMAYETWDGAYWLMGGYDSANNINDTWSSTDGAVWTRRNASSGWINAGAYSEPPRAVVGPDGNLWLFNWNGTYWQSWFLTTANATAGLWTRANASISNYGATWPIPIVYNNQFYIGPLGYWQLALTSTDGRIWTVTSLNTTGCTQTNGYSCTYRSPGPVKAIGETIVTLGGISLYDSSQMTDVIISTDGINWSHANMSAGYPLRTAYTGGLHLTPWKTFNSTVPWHDWPELLLSIIEQVGVTPYLHHSVYTNVPPPAANATPIYASGTAPLAVGWHDTSVGYASSWLWDFKDGYFSYDQNASHIFTAPGTYTVEFKPQSQFGSSSFFANVSAGLVQYNIASNVHHVRIVFTDPFGHGIPGLNVTAAKIEMTYVNVSWVESLLGVPGTVNISEPMIGTTDSAGSITFFMVQGAKYQVTATNTTTGINKAFSIYAIEDQYTFHIETTPETPDLFETAKWDLSSSTYSPTEISMNLSYNDTANQTDLLTFYVNSTLNGTPLYSASVPLVGGAGEAGYVITNTKGESVTCGFIANNTVFGTVRDAIGITMEGTGRLLELGWTAEAYLWASYIILFTVAGLFSYSNVKFGALILPFVAGGLYWIGWLPISWVLLGSLMALGVLIYINRSEPKVR